MKLTKKRRKQKEEKDEKQMDEIRLTQHYNSMAHRLESMIPCEWERIVLGTKENGQVGFITFYYYTKDGERHHWSDIPKRIYEHKDARDFSGQLRDLELINKTMWQECREAGEQVWSSFTLDMDCNNVLKTKFGYEEDELSELESEIKWAYDELELVPYDEYSKKILKKQLMAQGRKLPKKLRDKKDTLWEKVSIVDTPERYKKYAEELIPFLVQFLRQLNVLEEEIFIRYKKLNQDKFRLGIPAQMAAPGDKELNKEYKRRFLEIANGICSKELLERGICMKFGSPTEYAYIDKSCSIVFTMKNSKQAVIETKFHKGIDKKHQFILKETPKGWQIYDKNYGFMNDVTWYKDNI